MKYNIFKTLLPVAAIAVSGMLTSCMGDLDSDIIDPDAKEFDANKLFTKCYASLIMEGTDGSADFSIDDAGKSTLVRNIYNLECLSTDESVCWWTDGGIVKLGNNQGSSDDQIYKFMYYRCMFNITFCNYYLNNQECKDLGDQKYAEVRWIRAFNYYNLANEFGNVPLMDHIMMGDEAQNITQANRSQMYDWLVGEFRAAEEDLAAAQPKYTNDDPMYGRVDKAAAWLMLSRLYLNSKVWKGAQTETDLDSAAYYAKMVMDKYPIFEGNVSVTDGDVAYEYNAYDMLFMADNDENGALSEAVLPLIQDGNTTQGWGGMQFFIAAHWSDAMRTVNGLENGSSKWSGMRCRQQLIEKFTNNPDAFVGKTAKEIRQYLVDNNMRDDRALFWGKDQELSIGDNKSFSQGIATVKFSNVRSDGQATKNGGNSDGDYFLLRSAEAYLNYAEALTRKGHIDVTPAEQSSVVVPTGEATKALNALRTRAHAATSNIWSLADILDERAREFYCEGYRRTDLIRFGQFGGNQASYQWEGKNGTIPGTNFDSHINVYPIPISEIEASNGKLKQNTGY